MATKKRAKAVKPAELVAFHDWYRRLPPCIPASWIAPYCGVSRTAAANAMKEGRFVVHSFVTEGRRWEVVTRASADAYRDLSAHAATRWDRKTGGYVRTSEVKGTPMLSDHQMRW